MHDVFQDCQYSLRRSVEPSYLPVTLTDAKEVLKFGTTTAADDREIENNLFVAVAAVEEDCQRSIANQTWVLKLDRFPPVIELRRPPITAVSSVQYVDLDGVTQTWSSSNYDADITSAPGRIMPTFSSTGWPTTKIQPNAVIVTFTAGYGAAIPPIATKAILLQLKALYSGCEVGSGYWSLINRLRWEGGI